MNGSSRTSSSAAWLSLAAFTPELISVPITIPIDNVNRIKVNESSFCERNLSNILMGFSYSSRAVRADLRDPAPHLLFRWMLPRI